MKNKGIVIPVALLVTGLVAAGVFQQKIKTNTSEIEKKVSKEVYDANKESDDKQHEQIQNSLNTIQADVKELLKK